MYAGLGKQVDQHQLAEWFVASRQGPAELAIGGRRLRRNDGQIQAALAHGDFFAGDAGPHHVESRSDQRRPPRCLTDPARRHVAAFPVAVPRRARPSAVGDHGGQQAAQVVFQLNCRFRPGSRKPDAVQVTSTVCELVSKPSG